MALASIRDEKAREAGRLIGEKAAEAALGVGGIDPDIVQAPYRPRTAPTVAAAIGEVMKLESGLGPSAPVRVASLANPNSVLQTLPGWDEWVRQVSDSRIYAGVHYRFSNEAGEEIGRRATRAVVEGALRPIAKRKGKR